MTVDDEDDWDADDALDSRWHRAALDDDAVTAAHLIDNGADINAALDDGRTPLHYAAIFNAYRLACLLIDKGASQNTLDERGLAPVHSAAENNALSVMKALIASGANPDSRSSDQKTPLHYAAAISPMILGKSVDEALQIINFLLNHGADINAADSMGDTPLHAAVEVGAEQSIELLVASGANIDTKNKLGTTPGDNVLFWGVAGLSPAIKSLIASSVCKHGHTLRRTRRKSTDDYGMINIAKWTAELVYFTNQIIFPVLSPSSTYMNWALGRMDRLTDAVVQAIHDELDGFVPDIDVSRCDDSMDPIAYEQMCASILDSNGWDIALTNATGDQGIDIVARKNGELAVLQCKKYSSPVGNKAVQEIYAGKGFIGASVAAVVSNAAYTRSAVELASSLGVLLLHHDDLADLLSILQSQK